MICIECGAEVSKLHLFIFADSPEKTVCAGCGADMVDRQKYAKWKGLVLSISLLTATPVVLLTTHVVSILVISVLGLAAYISFPVRSGKR